MIRVNLMKSKVNTQATAETAQGVFTTSFDGEADENKRDALIKLVLICVGVASLMFYEDSQLDGLKAQVNAASKKVKEQSQRNTERKKATESLSHLENDAKILGEKLSVIKKLSGDRLKILKALDQIQSKIPEKVWLTGLNYNNHKMMLLGLAVSDDDLNEFIRQMENAGTFSNVILTQAKEVSSATGTTKTFEIKSEVN